jgi:hypothetical protein
LFSQGKLDYDRDSKWFWGFNYGATWQTTDINYKFNNGWGLTIGKSFNYNYGKVFSFDIRGRYLTGNWYGQNTDSTQLPSSYQGVYSQQGTNYKDSLGYTYLNFHSKINRLALELVIHANRIRETTGFDPYIFGGIGLTWYDSKANLINDNSFESNPIYNYDSLENYNVNSLTSFQDKTYETLLSSYKPAFMPSLGFGLGYQIGKRVSIGLEHKTTFTQRDNFDGIIKTSKYKQDLYHYTSAYIRFQIRNSSSRNENNQSNTVQTSNPPLTDPTNPQPTSQPPIVTFTNPVSSGTIVNSANYVIRADVKYVNDRDHIIFKQENSLNSNFTYNSSNHQLVSNVVLQLGSNTFEITGTNQFGSDVKSTIVIYKRDEGTPPIVTIINPSINPTTVNNSVYNFTANILNVEQSNQIELNFNGQNFIGFNFNPITHNISATLNLKPGSNIISVKGSNNFGTDSKTTSINFERQQVSQPPVVTITNPSVNPFSVSIANYNLVATILNVTTQNQISVKFNGQVTSNFTFNPVNHSISVPLNLNLGSNNLTVVGTNSIGSDSKSTVIIYRKVEEKLPPSVSITNPINNPHSTKTASQNIDATVLNVESQNNIQVFVNGLSVTNFTYNVITTKVNFEANLVEGSNNIEIKVSNEIGQAADNTIVFYRKEAVIPPPFVLFFNPVSSGLIVKANVYSMKAKVNNVTSISQIELKKDNQIVNQSAYSFNSSTKEVVFNTNLVEGKNYFTVKGSNTTGTHTDSTFVIYEIQTPPCASPVLSISGSSIPNFSKTTEENVTLQINTSNILNQNQLGVFCNGNSIPFSFNLQAQSITISKELIVGINDFQINAINNCGRTSNQYMVTREAKIQVKPPVVSFIYPNSCPMKLPVGKNLIKGNIINITNANQVTISVNNEAIPSFNPMITKNGLYFEFSLDVLNTVNEYVIIVKAINSAGTDSKTCNGFSYNSSGITPPIGTNSGVVSPTKPTETETPTKGKGGK